MFDAMKRHRYNKLIRSAKKYMRISAALVWPDAETSAKIAEKYLDQAIALYDSGELRDRAMALAGEYYRKNAWKALDRSRFVIVSDMAKACLEDASEYLDKAEQCGSDVKRERYQYDAEIKKRAILYDPHGEDYGPKEILFGSYPQSADGNEKSPIQWDLLDDTIDGLILISKYILDAVPYQESGENTSWRETSLCHWLNHDFLNTAFTEEERERIDPEIGVAILSYGNLWHYYDTNERGWLGTRGEDCIFSDTLMAEPTAYALSKSVFNKHFTEDMAGNIWVDGEDVHFNSASEKELYDRTGAFWWLMRDSNYCGTFVTASGVARKTPYYSDTAKRTDIGVRPVIMLKKE